MKMKIYNRGVYKSKTKPIELINSHTTTCRSMRIGQYLLQQEAAFIKQSLGNKTELKKLVELGCGDGWISLELQRKGFTVLGLDIDRMALVRLQQLSPELPLVQGNCQSLPFASGSLFGIVAIHVFDHLDRIQFFKECKRVLGSNGMMIFDALNRHSYKLALKRLQRRTGTGSGIDPLDKYIEVMSCREVLDTADRFGFDTVAISGYGWIPFTVNSDSKMINAAIMVELILGLTRFSNVSPRILLALRKR